MCTQEQAKEAAVEAINDTLFKRDTHGESRLSKEIDGHIEEYINKMVTKLTFRFAVTVISITAIATVSWMQLSNRVAHNEESIVEHHDEVNRRFELNQERLDERLQGIEKSIDRLVNKLDA